MSLAEFSAIDASTAGDSRPVAWDVRYDGVVAVAQVDGKSVAGISGPWSDKYALTWWERPLPQRQLELFDSLDEAKLEVERWAQRLREGIPNVEPAPTPSSLAVTQPPSADLIGRLRDAVGRAWRPRPVRLRTQRPRREIDIGGLHFGAND